MLSLLLLLAKRSIAIAAVPIAIIFVGHFFSGNTRDEFVSITASSIAIALFARFGADQYLYKLVTTSDSSPSNELLMHARSSLGYSLILSVIIAFLMGTTKVVSIDSISQFSFIALVATFTLLSDRSTLQLIKSRYFVSSLLFPGALLLAIVSCMMLGFELNNAILLGCFFVVLAIGKNLLSDYFYLQVVESKYSNVSHVFREQLPFAALNINRIAFDWGIVILILPIMGAASASIFVIGSRLAAILSLPLNALNAYLLKSFSIDQHSNTATRSDSVSAKVVFLCLVFQVIILTLFFLFIDKISTLFNVNSELLVPFLIPLCFAQVVHGLTGPVGSRLMITGHQKFVAIIAFCISLLNIGIIPIIAISYNLTGVGCFMASTHITQNILFWTYYNRQREN